MIIKITVMFRYIWLIIIVLCAVSCERNILFEEKKEMPGGLWMYRDTLDFGFAVADTVQRYNLYLDFEYADTFPNQNIYLKLYTRFPDGRRLNKALSFDLFDAKGAPSGKCSGGTCSAQFVLQQNAFFNLPGAYVITLEQFTRRDSLAGIKAVGFVIEKAGQ